VTILPVTGTADDSTRIRVAAVDALVIWTLADDDPVLTAVQAQVCPAVMHSGPAIAGAGLVTIDNRAAARAIGAVTFARACNPAVLSFPADRDRANGITAGLPPAAASFPVPATGCRGSATPPRARAWTGHRSRSRSAPATTALRQSLLRISSSGAQPARTRSPP
jgi:hypothetical protein